MRSIDNVVDFADLCIFAEQEKLAFYNEAHDALVKDAYPWPESPMREVYLSELEYARNPLAREILTKYMTANKVDYITVSK